jgi:hypothetical protein
MSRGAPGQPGENSRSVPEPTGREDAGQESGESSKKSGHDPDLAGELLECVVRETISAVNDEATIEKIKAFVIRHRTRDVTDPDVAEELIRVVVKSRFGSLDIPPELPRWIAESLLDDPVSSERLQTVWSQAQVGQP